MPDCVKVHFTISGLNESDPVPVQVPVTSIVAGAGTAGAVGAVGDAGAGGEEDPHDDSNAPKHAKSMRAAIDRI